MPTCDDPVHTLARGGVDGFEIEQDIHRLKPVMHQRLVERGIEATHRILDRNTLSLIHI